MRLLVNQPEDSMRFVVSNFWSAPRVLRRPVSAHAQSVRTKRVPKGFVPDLSVMSEVRTNDFCDRQGFIPANDPTSARKWA